MGTIAFTKLIKFNIKTWLISLLVPQIFLSFTTVLNQQLFAHKNVDENRETVIKETKTNQNATLEQKPVKHERKNKHQKHEGIKEKVYQ